MKILLDFTQIPLKRTGVGVYADALVQNLKLLLPLDDQLIIVTQSDDNVICALRGSQSNLRIVQIPSGVFRNRLLLMLFEQTALPLLAWIMHADLIHSLHYTHPLVVFSRCVVTIHDLTFLLFPRMHTRRKRWIMPLFIRHAMKHADAVIFVSEASRKDAERMFPDCSNVRCIAPLGVSTTLMGATVSGTSEEALIQIGVSKPYLLFLGTLEPRKNLVRIVQAFEHVAQDHPSLTLVIAGKLGWHTEEIVAALENSAVRSRIRHLGFVAEMQKGILLRCCEMLVYPSLYEGFGLPVLEGMASGAPVITSNISSMPEVAGNAALLVDPTSVDEIAAAMRRILDQVGLAERLREAGRAQAMLFTWKRTAKSTLSVYAAVTGEKYP